MKKSLYFPKSSLILLFFTFLYIASIQQADAQIYVKADATAGANNGSSWTNAYTNLQSALTAATAGEKIYIAKGIYKPTQQFDFDGLGANSREVTFKIPNGVEVYGGFTGTETSFTQTDLDARDFIANETILSGDLNGDDNVTGTFPTFSYGNYADNAFHVVVTTNVSAATKIDGFIITAGNANDTTFSNNFIAGGWYNGSTVGNTSNPTLSNIIFLKNRSFRGGAMYNSSRGISNPTLTNCSFVQNTSDYGGGIYNNSFNSSSSPTLTNCSFSQNKGIYGGGGMYNRHEGTSGTNNPQIINCIFWRNAGTGESWLNALATPNVSFSLVEETTLPAGTTTTGGNNILGQDPLFVDAANGNLRLSCGSPALNVGSNAAIPTGVTTDADGNPRTQNGTVDMGAYERPTQTEFFVKATGGNDTNTGADFNNAYATLQKALENACSGSKIYIAAGTYKPTQEFDFDGNGTDPREATFQIPDGVEVYGGFAGTETSFTQTDLDARDFVTNETILSGDLNGDDNVTGAFPNLT